MNASNEIKRKNNNAFNLLKTSVPLLFVLLLFGALLGYIWKEQSKVLEKMEARITLLERKVPDKTSWDFLFNELSKKITMVREDLQRESNFQREELRRLSDRMDEWSSILKPSKRTKREF